MATLAKPPFDLTNVIVKWMSILRKKIQDSKTIGD